MRGLKGAASRVFWQLICKWGGCLGGCSCRKHGEEKGESDGQVGERKEKKRKGKEKEKERKGKWVAALGFSLGQKMEVGCGP